MKIAFLVSNDVISPRVMKLLEGARIDYYTKWEHVKGKGHGTDPHLDTRSFPGTNVVYMIAFEQEASLEKLVDGINATNKDIPRPDDHIRLFQVPLERIV
ncbi:MAG TPA: PG0541 family transporter-associated protein [Candidatus Kryptonia bacterium]